MFAYFLRRIPSLVFVLVGMTIIMFIISHSIPGDPAMVAAGQDANAEMIEKIRSEMGLDRPLIIQYLIYMKSLCKGDLGTSIMTGRPVLDEILDYLPATVELAIASTLFSIALGIPLGVVSAIKPGKFADHLSRIVSLIGVCSPVFWLGLMFQLIFYKEIGILPFGGRLDSNLSFNLRITGLYTIDSLITGNTTIFLNSLKHLILPSIVMSNISLAIVTRMTRSSLLDVLMEDYIMTARAKGLSERAVIYIHALRNASIPIATVIGLRLGTLFAGAVLTETVFSWPGIGQYAFKAIEAMDFPVLMGFSIVVSFMYAIINLGMDLLYMVLDPRMRIST